MAAVQRDYTVVLVDKVRPAAHLQRPGCAELVAEHKKAAADARVSFVVAHNQPTRSSDMILPAWGPWTRPERSDSVGLVRAIGPGMRGMGLRLRPPNCARFTASIAGSGLLTSTCAGAAAEEVEQQLAGRLADAAKGSPRRRRDGLSGR